MSAPVVPHEIGELFERSQAPSALLDALMPGLCRALDCPRCLLFLRDPERRLSCLTHSWWDKPEHAFSGPTAWFEEPESLASDDPLFGEALRNPKAIFVDDIERAGPQVLNLEYERREFRHRGLIHAPIYHHGRLVGILEPCVFDAPRLWSAEDRALTAWLQQRLGPIAAAYVAAHAPR